MQREHAELPIHEMDQRHPGLTQAIAEHQTEAIRVCLDRHHKKQKKRTVGCLFSGMGGSRLGLLKRALRLAGLATMMISPALLSGTASRMLL